MDVLNSITVADSSAGHAIQVHFAKDQMGWRHGVEHFEPARSHHLGQHLLLNYFAIYGCAFFSERI
jgi:hypothetical protein